MLLSDRLRRGRELAREQYIEEGKEKLGHLRAGNSGMMSPAGEVTGACHRVAHLRQLGIDFEIPSDNTLVMFQMGYANEEVVYQDLIRTSAPDEIVLRESEIPTKWLTANGTIVSGRPDMVVCRKTEDGKSSEPVYGIELKSVASVWTTREVLFEENPKLEHMIQAAHYAWQLKVPFKLVYKQYNKQTIPAWGAKLLPKPGDKYSEYIEYGSGNSIKAIIPFEVVYDIRLEPTTGQVQYRLETSQDKWNNTIIYVADIIKFYEYVSKMEAGKELGPRPMALSASGEKKNYKKCDYCPLKSTCDKHEKKGYDTWLKEVKKTLT